MSGLEPLYIKPNKLIKKNDDDNFNLRTINTVYGGNYDTALSSVTNYEC